MSLEERGLFISILCECWVNRSLPSDPQSIGKWLGFAKDSIEAALTERVLSFFKTDKSEITSPELERYRTKLEEQRGKMSRGGRRGATNRWEKRLDSDSPPINPLDRVSMGSRGEKSGNEMNRRERKRDEPRYKEDLADSDNEQWITQYENYSQSTDDLIPF
ncbi:hypothetical protein [Nitrosospira sp. Is2]|uniref:hypothetical protein n=1 Tax=Nitrosospira sp. Is2 TaxID=3080532 RepID=UPI0029541FEC|nr:hypothetical protein [Nitrosospira sp. Is2]WON72495.1 hypothetical protein R5L00_08205 [Nitrosospira sp. Is2]